MSIFACQKMWIEGLIRIMRVCHAPENVIESARFFSRIFQNLNFFFQTSGNFEKIYSIKE